jgi:hypothetical protein
MFECTDECFPAVEVPTTVSPKPGEGGFSTAVKSPTGTVATSAIPKSPIANKVVLPTTVAGAAVTGSASAATKIESSTALAGDGQDRQHATYFAGWGAPETRTSPRKYFMLLQVDSHTDTKFRG